MAKAQIIAGLIILIVAFIMAAIGVMIKKEERKIAKKFNIFKFLKK
ncbi:MAG: hypothetical protein WC523_06835 [Patescibacteria group bacterium]|jgi:uncharacterized membrane protein